jgi:hypothetical protein
VIGIGESPEGALEPPVKLCPARPCPDEVRVDTPGRPIIFYAKRSIALPMAPTEKSLQNGSLARHLQTLLHSDSADQNVLIIAGDETRKRQGATVTP